MINGEKEWGYPGSTAQPDKVQHNGIACAHLMQIGSTLHSNDAFEVSQSTDNPPLGQPLCHVKV
jgi:hypothetical protein